MQRSAVIILISSSMSGNTAKEWPSFMDPGRAYELSKHCDLQPRSGTAKNSQRHNFS